MAYQEAVISSIAVRKSCTVSFFVKRQIKRLTGGIIKSQQHTPLVSPIGYIQVDISGLPRNVWLLPSMLYIMQFSFDSRGAYMVLFCELLNGLLVVLIDIP